MRKFISVITISVLARVAIVQQEAIKKMTFRAIGQDVQEGLEYLDMFLLSIALVTIF